MKRPSRKTKGLEITHQTQLGQIFERNMEETKRNIKQKLHTNKRNII